MGGSVDETVELELLRVVLDELVGVVVEELEVLVDPQPEIVEYESEQDTRNPISIFPVVVQELDVETQELLLIEVGGGAVLILQPRLLIVVS